jgi:hypothetical protein
VSATDPPLLEPAAKDFFASAEGVCVYVNVRGRAFRVRFETPDGPPSISGTTQKGSEEAAALAGRALVKHRDELAHLFQQVELERAARQG